MHRSSEKDNRSQVCPQQAFLRGGRAMWAPGQGGPWPSISAEHPRLALASPCPLQAPAVPRGHQLLCCLSLVLVPSA